MDDILKVKKLAYIARDPKTGEIKVQRTIWFKSDEQRRMIIGFILRNPDVFEVKELVYFDD